MKKDDLLDNRYQILEKLGKGGMGEVYKAYDQVLKKDVAIKTLLPEVFSDERAADQFRKEVNLTQNLRHDNITTIYDLKFSEEIPFIVMEYVEGQVLSNFIYRQHEHRFDESTFLELANQILNGVEHAHKKGTIHRDLKSNNIMITDDGEVKIMDFGIAASLKETYSKSTGTPTTLSIHYASPEQINGKEPSESMDIYSLGCVFYEMLDGEPPFRKGDILHQQLTKKPETIKHISPHLNSVILKCLEKRKEDRFQRVGEIKLALEGKDIGVTVKIPKVRKKKPKPTFEKRRIPMFMKGIVVFLFLALCVSGYFLIYYISKKESGFESKTLEVLEQKIEEKIPEKKEVQRQKELQKQDDEEFYQALQKDTIAAYEDYLKKYPYGNHANDARKKNEAIKHRVSISQIGEITEVIIRFTLVFSGEKFKCRHIIKINEESMFDSITEFPISYPDIQKSRLRFGEFDFKTDLGDISITHTTSDYAGQEGASVRGTAYKLKIIGYSYTKGENPGHPKLSEDFFILKVAPFPTGDTSEYKMKVTKKIKVLPPEMKIENKS